MSLFKATGVLLIAVLGATSMAASVPSAPGCQAISPPPVSHLPCSPGLRLTVQAGVNCSIPGYWNSTVGYDFTSPTSNATTKVNSLEECATLCHSIGKDLEVTCNALIYDKTLGICLPSSLSANFYYAPPWTVNASSPTVMYDAKCFTCPAICPQPQGTNLIQNGGAEFSKQYYGPFGDYFDVDVSPGFRIVSPGHNSANAFLVNETSGSVLYSLRSCPNTMYYTSFDYKIVSNGKSPVQFTSMGTQFHLGVVFATGYGSVVYGNLSTNGEWATVRAIYPDAGLLMGMGTNTPSSEVEQYYFDNVVQYAIPPPVAQPGAKNLVENGGFETGSLAPWTALDTSTKNGKQGSFSVSGPSFDGSKYAAVATAGNRGRNAVSLNVALQQVVPTTVGSTYILSFNFTQHISDGNGLIIDGISIGVYFGNVTKLMEPHADPGNFLARGNYTYNTDFQQVGPHPGVQTLSYPFVANDAQTPVTIHVVGIVHKGRKVGIDGVQVSQVDIGI